jgi:hypothetical protein
MELFGANNLKKGADSRWKLSSRKKGRGRRKHSLEKKGTGIYREAVWDEQSL